MTRDGLTGFEKLEATLDTYGADRTRWPAPLRHELSSFIAGRPEARKLIADAEAFDRLLDAAPHYDVARLRKLQERIAVAASRQPRLVGTNTEPPRRAAPALRRNQGLAATALAASLVLGIFAGQSSIISSLWGGDGSGYANASRQLAQSDDADGLLDEDLL